LRYFITFACYGARLHSDEMGSVDRNHNLVGSRLLEPDPKRVMSERRRMLQDPYVLGQESRAVVLAALRRHCTHRGWDLLAVHVRSNHVHAILEAEIRPERIMNEFKVYASCELNRLGDDGLGRKRWARHGSTRWLWQDQDVREAIRYVVEEQGEPMALFLAGQL
jgi:REP element-mobilizing transposase RayT